MKKIILSALCAMLAPTLWGQEAQPQWVESRSRAFIYPAETYITGFAQGNRRSGEALADAIARVKQDAKAELVGSVRSSVKSVTLQSTRQDADYNVSSTFGSATSTVSDADVADLKTEHYVGKTDGAIYAFAYIRRQDLIGYYQGQISLHLNSVEGALQSAEQLLGQGAKAKARKECQRTSDLMDKVRYAQDLLTAVDNSAGGLGLQQQRSRELESKMSTMLNALENSNFVFLKCPEEMAVVAEQVSGLLTEGDCGCSCTDSEQEADMVVTLTPKIKRSTEDAASRQVFCYASATVSIRNTRSNKTIRLQVGEVKGGWTNGDFEKAEDVALRELSQQIAEKLQPYFKN